MGCGIRPGGSSGRPTPTHHSPIELRRGRRPRRPALPWARCGLAMTHYKKCGTNPAGDRKGRPYESATKGAMGGRPQGSPLRKRYKGCGAKRNPPVTAAPCQPPLGKGDEGTGGTDCHGQCAHWLRNDRGFCKGCGTGMKKQVSRFTHLFFYHVLFNNPLSSGTGPPGGRWGRRACGLYYPIFPGHRPAPSGHGPPPAGCPPGCGPYSAKNRCRGR